MKVRFSEEAAQRYDAVLGYIREQNPLAADRMVTAVHRSRSTTKFFLVGDGVVGGPFLVWEVLGFCSDWEGRAPTFQESS